MNELLLPEEGLCEPGLSLSELLCACQERGFECLVLVYQKPGLFLECMYSLR
jgi:hypothetical protein